MISKVMIIIDNIETIYSTTDTELSHVTSHVQYVPRGIKLNKINIENLNYCNLNY